MCDPITMQLIGAVGAIGKAVTPKAPTPVAPTIIQPPAQQLAKTPGAAQVMQGVQQNAAPGVSSTLLTGPGGVNPSSLNVGSTLLGA